MASVNTTATYKFVIVLNEKSSIGKLLSATGQIAMSLYSSDWISHLGDVYPSSGLSFILKNFALSF